MQYREQYNNISPLQNERELVAETPFELQDQYNFGRSYQAKRDRKAFLKLQTNVYNLEVAKEELMRAVNDLDLD